MEQVLLTPSALLDFLLQVDELGDMTVSVSETADGNIQVLIGDSVYSIDCSSAKEVQVEPKTVDEVSDINEEAYEDIIESDDSVEQVVDVEAGLIKEFVKTLAVGGLARLAGKAVKDYMRS